MDDTLKRQPGSEPARVRWLRARPASGPTFDHYDDGPRRLAWVQLTGPRPCSTSPATRRIEALVERYTPYRERAPRGPLLRIEAQRIISWRAAANGS